jgi:hypothetical protein
VKQFQPQEKKTYSPSLNKALDTYRMVKEGRSIFTDDRLLDILKNCQLAPHGIEAITIILAEREAAKSKLNDTEAVAEVAAEMAA